MPRVSARDRARRMHEASRRHQPWQGRAIAETTETERLSDLAGSSGESKSADRQVAVEDGSEEESGRGPVIEVNDALKNTKH
jgi:hypothetical protein